MDKNTIIGIVLMVVLFIGYGVFQANEMEKQQEVAAAQTEKKEAQKAEQARLAAEAKAVEDAMTPEQRGEREALAKAKERFLQKLEESSFNIFMYETV